MTNGLTPPNVLGLTGTGGQNALEDEVGEGLGFRV
jgi:hypothetical protein